MKFQKHNVNQWPHFLFTVGLVHCQQPENLEPKDENRQTCIQQKHKERKKNRCFPSNRFKGENSKLKGKQSQKEQTKRKSKAYMGFV